MKQTLRTNKTQEKYNNFKKENKNKKCYMCKSKAIKEFKYWKIIENQFPYDLISDTHHMITPKRHKKDNKLTKKETKEFKKVKKYVDKNYDLIFENTTRSKSIPQHHHLHIIELKEIKVKHANTKIEKIKFSFSLGNFKELLPKVFQRG